MERQNEDTFNRFEVLDELGQQEVIPGSTNAEPLVTEPSDVMRSTIPLFAS